MVTFRSFAAAILLAVAFCVVAPFTTAYSQGTTTLVVSPVRDWREPPIQDKTGQKGQAIKKVCAIEARFENEILVAVLRNRENEFALRVFFPTVMFSPGIVYPVSLHAADGTGGDYKAIPVFPGTVLIELGKSDNLLKSFSKSGSLKISFGEDVYELKAGTLEQGLDYLTGCADSMGASVQSAGVAGPLPQTGGLGMVAPRRDIAKPLAAQQIEVANLNPTNDHGGNSTGSHIQEQLIEKPLKNSSSVPSVSDISSTVDTVEGDVQEKETVSDNEQSGFSFFSIFGDQDIEDTEAEITAQSHKNERSKAPSALVPQTKNDANAEVAPVKQVQAKTNVTSKSVDVGHNHSGKMIVFENEAVTTDQSVENAENIGTNGKQGADEKDLSVQTEVMPASSTIKSTSIEQRLAELEQRLSYEMDRNRQLERQLHEMKAKPVSASASIDLSTGQGSKQDRLAQARIERMENQQKRIQNRLDDLVRLLDQAGIPLVARPAPEGDLESSLTSFSWHTGTLYGGAEFSKKPRDIPFADIVAAYLEATGQRCKGDYASSIQRLVDLPNKNIAEAEAVCVGSDSNSAAAIVFYADPNTLGVITHEGTAEDLDQAMHVRDAIAYALSN